MKKNPVFFPAKKRTKSTDLHIRAPKAAIRDIDFKVMPIGKAIRKKLILNGSESLIVLLSGKISIKTDDSTHLLGPRKDVFAGRATSLYATGNKSLMITGVHKTSQCAIISIPVSTKEVSSVCEIPPQKVRTKTVGKSASRRKVHTIFHGPSMPFPSHLIVGETMNEPGKWSSFPPHKHALERPPRETRYEEIYFFKVAPRDRFGLMRVYGGTTDETYAIHDEDAVIVTDGYHPLCAAPDTQLYYLWVLYGRNTELINAYDPAFH